MAKLSAGSYDLNKWLHGGYDSDVITTLYGGPGSGKTNLCLQAAVSQAKKGKKVIFVDTEGGFSSERVKQLVEKGNGPKDQRSFGLATSKDRGKIADKENITMKVVLENIFVLKPTNFTEQKQSFKDLLKYLKKHVSLVVVDGMTMLYRLEFAAARERDNKVDAENGNKISGNGIKEEIQKANAELVKQMRTLAEIARKQNIPVLVTNQVYRWEDNSNMVGGDILKYWSKCLIELTNENGRRTAHLRKHRSLAEKSLGFQIWDGGVRKRGWI